MGLLEINDVKYENLIKYEIEKNQLWTPDSGRTYGDGSWNGTILGNFTKPTVSLYFTDKDKLSEFEKVLLSGSITVKFYDTRTKDVRTRVFYRNNYKVKIKGYYDEGSEQYFDSIDVNFTPHERD